MSLRKETRNKLLAVICFIFLCPAVLFGQQKPVKKSWDSAVKEQLVKHQSPPYFRKAYSFYTKRSWDSTLIYSLKQLQVTKNKELADYCHYFRGYAFMQKKLLKEARQEFLQVSRQFLFFNNVWSNLGDISLEKEQYHQAIGYYNMLRELPDNENSGLKKGGIEHNLGVCYFHLKLYPEAEIHLNRGISLQEYEKDTAGQIVSYMDLANLYYEQYIDVLAIPYFEKAYQLSRLVKDVELKQAAALNMAVVEENRKNFEAALKYRTEYEAWHDSLNDQNKVWDIAQLEKQFAVKQKQEEVNVLAAENKLKIAERNGFIYVAILLAVLLGAGVYFYRLNQKRSAIIMDQKTELDELNAAKDKLFSIVSHDLRSSVNALKTSNTNLQTNLEAKNYAGLDEQLQTNSAIANGAYNLLDNLLHWALLQTGQSYFKQESLRLYQLVEQVAYNYRHLMLEKNIRFENAVPKSTVVFADPESLKIVLRNLLDNAIKFSEEEGEIVVIVRPAAEMVDLVIKDTGYGMSETMRLNLLKETIQPAKKEHEQTIGTGLGLQLCKSMIAKNGGTFSIESEEGVGTSMIVSLPKTEKNG